MAEPLYSKICRHRPSVYTRETTLYTEPLYSKKCRHRPSVYSREKWYDFPVLKYKNATLDLKAIHDELQTNGEIIRKEYKKRTEGAPTAIMLASLTFGYEVSYEVSYDDEQDDKNIKYNEFVKVDIRVPIKDTVYGIFDYNTLNQQYQRIQNDLEQYYHDYQLCDPNNYQLYRTILKLWDESGLDESKFHGQNLVELIQNHMESDAKERTKLDDIRKEFRHSEKLLAAYLMTKGASETISCSLEREIEEKHKERVEERFRHSNYKVKVTCLALHLYTSWIPCATCERVLLSMANNNTAWKNKYGFLTRLQSALENFQGNFSIELKNVKIPFIVVCNVYTSDRTHIIKKGESQRRETCGIKMKKRKKHIYLYASGPISSGEVTIENFTIFKSGQINWWGDPLVNIIREITVRADRAKAKNIRDKAEEIMDKANKITVKAKKISDKAKAKEKKDKAKKITDKANEITDKVKEITDKAKEIMDKAKEIMDKARKITDEAKAKELSDKAKEITDKAKKITEIAKEITDKAKAIKIAGKAEEITDKAEEITKKAKEIRDKSKEITDKV